MSHKHPSFTSSQTSIIHKFTNISHTSIKHSSQSSINNKCLSAAKCPTPTLLEAAATAADVVHTRIHLTAAEAAEVTLLRAAPHSNPPIEPAQMRRNISTDTKA